MHDDIEKIFVCTVIILVVSWGREKSIHQVVLKDLFRVSFEFDSRAACR